MVLRGDGIGISLNQSSFSMVLKSPDLLRYVMLNKVISSPQFSQVNGSFLVKRVRFLRQLNSPVLSAVGEGRSDTALWYLVEERLE